ncbi:hypothetical protein M426DRAFT_211306 [Hypoxylon sp. CI-4A]|nr:hypothetical protein M426DRAFT_211306 [Hypoxylon sp. CI-4A]
MAAARDTRVTTQEPPKAIGEPNLLWNQETVRDVAEAVGAHKIGDEALRTLTKDTEYRIGQLIVEALRFMRLARRTHMTPQDISHAMRVLDVQPLYGYDSTRGLTYGEASLGPQALFYVEDEEIDLDKLINTPLPKISRDVHFGTHYLAIEGVVPNLPENVTSAELRTLDLLPKGPGANPALAALSGQDNPAFKPAVKHMISQELVLYFEKLQSALMDDTPGDEGERLRRAALDTVKDYPSMQQLLPYFVTWISNQVTHNLEDIFVLRQMLELLQALLENEKIELSTYASSLANAALTCLLGRKIGNESGIDAIRAQYELREFAGALIGRLAFKFSTKNKMLRPRLVRTCLKALLNPMHHPVVLYGAVCGVAQAGGPEVVKVLLLHNLKEVENKVLVPLQEKRDPLSEVEYEALLGIIIKSITLLIDEEFPLANAMNGINSEEESNQVKALLGDIIGSRVLQLENHELNLAILDSKLYF